MTEHLSTLAKANWDKKRAIIALVFVIIVLLLLWQRRKPNSYINNLTNQILGQPALPGLSVAPITDQYQTGPLYVNAGSNPNLWDWMQSCDSACNCDELGWAAPNLPVTTYPVYSYLSVPAYPTTALMLDFPTWSPPPVKTWWYDVAFGRLDGQYMRLTYIRTQDGRKYSANGAFDYIEVNAPLDNSLVVSGDNLYVDGKRYVHDYSKDKKGQDQAMYGQA